MLILFLRRFGIKTISGMHQHTDRKTSGKFPFYCCGVGTCPLFRNFGERQDRERVNDADKMCDGRSFVRSLACCFFFLVLFHDLANRKRDLQFLDVKTGWVNLLVNLAASEIIKKIKRHRRKAIISITRRVWEQCQFYI